MAEEKGERRRIMMVNQERMLQEFFELVRIKCSTKEERQVADVLKARLAELGAAVSEDNAGEKIGGNTGNIIANWQGTVSGAPAVMFSAHMDCVEPCAGVEPKLENGIITSAGNTILGADDKAGVVAILEAMRVIKEQNIPHGDIQVVFTIAEEGGLNGSKNIDKAQLRAAMGFVLDSSGSPGEIIMMAPGQNKIEVLVRGKTAHAGIAPEDGVNAIIVAAKAMAELKDGRIDFETTANVGNIKGGGATNIVPEQVTIIAEARSRNMDKLAAQTQHMVETFERVAAANKAKAEVKVTKAYDPFVLKEEMPVVMVSKQAVRAIGLEPVLKGTGGGSDANFFNLYGIPSVVLGVGMNKVHTTDEFIKEADLYKTGELVISIIRQSVDC